MGTVTDRDSTVPTHVEAAGGGSWGGRRCPFKAGGSRRSLATPAQSHGGPQLPRQPTLRGAAAGRQPAAAAMGRSPNCPPSSGVNTMWLRGLMTVMSNLHSSMGGTEARTREQHITCACRARANGRLQAAGCRGRQGKAARRHPAAALTWLDRCLAPAARRPSPCPAPPAAACREHERGGHRCSGAGSGKPAAPGACGERAEATRACSCHSPPGCEGQDGPCRERMGSSATDRRRRHPWVQPRRHRRRCRPPAIFRASDGVVCSWRAIQGPDAPCSAAASCRSSAPRPSLFILAARQAGGICRRLRSVGHATARQGLSAGAASCRPANPADLSPPLARPQDCAPFPQTTGIPTSLIYQSRKP